MMHRLLIISLAVLCLASCSIFDLSSSKITVDDLQNPYTSIFNGSNLEGWVVMGNAEGWAVVDEIIHSDGGKGGNWLRSVKQYDNFSLKLDYKVSSGGNSGVFIRCTEEGNPWETGFECQISNEQPPRDEFHCTGTLYGYIKADPRPDETPDVWHSYEIVCKGNRIIVLVDGHKTVDVEQMKTDNIKDKPLMGYIGLQDSHTAEGCSIDYRNIYIREL
jgi:3-keto-disaccharide hydrolase